MLQSANNALGTACVAAFTAAHAYQDVLYVSVGESGYRRQRIAGRTMGQESLSESGRVSRLADG